LEFFVKEMGGATVFWESQVIGILHLGIASPPQIYRKNILKSFF